MDIPPIGTDALDGVWKRSLSPLSNDLADTTFAVVAVKTLLGASLAAFFIAIAANLSNMLGHSHFLGCSRRTLAEKQELQAERSLMGLPLAPTGLASVVLSVLLDHAQGRPRSVHTQACCNGSRKSPVLVKKTLEGIGPFSSRCR